METRLYRQSGNPLTPTLSPSGERESDRACLTGVPSLARQQDYALAAAPPLPFALLIVSHTRAGVAGMSMRSTPSGCSASMMALITVGGAPMVPDSPMPLTPSGLVLHGTSSNSASTFGIVSARGMP